MRDGKSVNCKGLVSTKTALILLKHIVQMIRLLLVFRSSQFNGWFTNFNINFRLPINVAPERMQDPFSLARCKRIVSTTGMASTESEFATTFIATAA